MNDTHYEALELINDLSKSLDSADVNAINEAFERLFEYTRAHYENEEAMMLEKRFPPYPAHKEDHDASLEEMQKEVSAFRRTHDVDAAKKYIDQKLIPWFLRHTETMDAVTSIFLENAEVHLPYWERLIPRNK